ncbi:MAG: cupin domain-containing protein [Streptosporangiaceae bacterium]
MPAHVDRHVGPQPDEEEIARMMEAEGLHGLRRWGGPPGDTYDWHEHSYEKILYCAYGEIVFHVEDGDAPMGPGDRMVLPPHTRHAATVGPAGVRCVEAQHRVGRV